MSKQSLWANLVGVTNVGNDRISAIDPCTETPYSIYNEARRGSCLCRNAAADGTKWNHCIPLYTVATRPWLRVGLVLNQTGAWLFCC